MARSRPDSTAQDMKVSFESYTFTAYLPESPRFTISRRRFVGNGLWVITLLSTMSPKVGGAVCVGLAYGLAHLALVLGRGN